MVWILLGMERESRLGRKRRMNGKKDKKRRRPWQIVDCRLKGEKIRQARRSDLCCKFKFNCINKYCI